MSFRNLLEQQILSRLPAYRQTRNSNVRIQGPIGHHAEAGWIVEVQVYCSIAGYPATMRMDEETMLLVVEELERFLQRPPPQLPPIRIEVVAPPAPKRRRRLSPAEELEDKSEVALSAEERAIHHRMLEGR